MKANEFVKKFGLDEAEIAIEDCKDNDLILFQHNETLESGMVDRRELKRLVESHELIDKVGGMDKAKLLLRMRIAAELYDSADEIEKAIADVESCQ